MEKNDDIIYITSRVNELFATTEINQYFTNPLKESIELTIIFPIREEITLSKFVVSIDDKIVYQKYYQKKKPKKNILIQLLLETWDFILVINQIKIHIPLILGI